MIKNITNTLNCQTLILPKMLLPNTTKKAFVIVDLAWKKGLAGWLFHLFLTILYIC